MIILTETDQPSPTGTDYKVDAVNAVGYHGSEKAVSLKQAKAIKSRAIQTSKLGGRTIDAATIRILKWSKAPPGVTVMGGNYQKMWINIYDLQRAGIQP
jgi:hypothetical protein